MDPALACLYPVQWTRRKSEEVSDTNVGIHRHFGNFPGNRPSFLLREPSGREGGASALLLHDIFPIEKRTRLERVLI